MKKQLAISVTPWTSCYSTLQKWISSGCECSIRAIAGTGRRESGRDRSWGSWWGPTWCASASWKASTWSVTNRFAALTVAFSYVTSCKLKSDFEIRNSFVKCYYVGNHWRSKKTYINWKLFRVCVCGLEDWILPVFLKLRFTVYCNKFTLKLHKIMWYWWKG